MANESSVLVRLRLLGGARFAAESKAAGKGLGSISPQAKTAQTRLQGFNRMAEKTVGVAKRVGAATAVMAGTGLAYGIKQSVTFEQSMANVQARLLTTGGNMDKLRNQALDLGAKTQFSAGQAADAMGVLAQQGFTTNQIMSVLPGTLSLAAAAGTDLATAAEIQTNTLHGFGLAAKDAGTVADVLAQIANRSAADIDDMQDSLKYIAPVAKATGQSFTDVGAAVGLMANVGIKGSQAGTTLRTALVRLTNPTTKAEGALKTLGLSVGDLRGKKGLLPLPQLLGKIIKGSQGLTKSQRNAAVASIFGREALSGVVSLITAGPKKYAKMTKALENSRGAAKRSADIMRNTVAGAWDNFTGSVETAAISLLHRFQPAMKHALGGAADLINNASKAAGDFMAGLTGEKKAKAAPAPRRVPGQAMEPRAVKNLTGAAGAGADLRAKLQPVMAWLQKTLPVVGKAIGDVAKQLVDAFKPAMPFITNVLFPLLKGIAEGVLISVVGAFKVLIPIIKVVATVLGAVGKAAEPFRGVIEKIGIVIGIVASQYILQFLSALKYIGPVFKVMLVPVRLANRIFGLLFGILGRLAGAFLRGFTWAQRFIGTFSGAGARVLRGATNFVGTIISAVERFPGKVVGIARSAGGKLVSGLANGVRGRMSSLVSFFGRIGKAILDAVVKAIKSAPGAIVGAITSIIPEKLRGAAKKVLGLVGAQSGGTIARGGWAVVGERGPELAHMPTGSTVYNANQTRKAMRGGGPMMPAQPIQVVANLHLSGKQIHSEVFRVERAALEMT